MENCRIFKENILLIATSNIGKARELQELFFPFDVNIITLSDIGVRIEPPDENGSDFIENANIKSKFYCEKTRYPTLADDSGLSVDDLDGEPGIYSARWADNATNFPSAMSKIENELKIKNLTSSKAHYTCALSLCWPDLHVENFQGKLHGTVNFPPKGTNGFGYDPIFTPIGYDKTLGEMSSEEKQKISHRQLAFIDLIKHCFLTNT